MKKVLTLICVFVLALSVMTLAACGNDAYTLTYSAGDGGYISVTFLKVGATVLTCRSEQTGP